MKSLVTGLVLIVISGAALIWNLASRNSGGPAAGPERTAKCMVWKAERGRAVVWLCGSFHLLREEDYPLPSPYLQAFSESRTVVMETRHDPADAAGRQEKIAGFGRLPEGDTLQQNLSAEAREALVKFCSEDGPAIGGLQTMRPWKAAFHLSNHTMSRLGFSAARGLESHFAASAGNRRLEGLETLEEQFAGLDKLDAASQEAMLVKVIAEASRAAQRAEENLAAWREGDTRRLSALNDESMAGIPALKQLLFHDRHAAWLPRLEQYLEGSETVMVLVGSLHFCGRGSLLEMLEAKGVKLTQMEYTTTRPANP